MKPNNPKMRNSCVKNPRKHTISHSCPVNPKSDTNNGFVLVSTSSAASSDSWPMVLPVKVAGNGGVMVGAVLKR